MGMLSYPDAIQAVKRLGGETSRPLMVKMDIEGYEWPVLLSLLTATVEGGGDVLPDQIALEMHEIDYERSGGPNEDLRRQGFDIETQSLCAGIVRKMRHAGYVLTSRVENPWCPQCTEVVWVREASL